MTTSLNPLATFLSLMDFLLSFNPPMQGWFGNVEFLAGFVFIAPIFIVKLQNLKFPLPRVSMSLAA